MVVQVKNYSPMAAFDVYEATVPLDLNLGWPIFVPSVEALNDRLDCDLASLDEGDGVARRVGDEEETLPPIPCSEFASGIAGRNGDPFRYEFVQTSFGRTKTGVVGAGP